jgi:hypothetical protein
MRTLIAILSIALLSAIATWILPWWMIAVVPFTVAAFMKPSRPFLTGFAGIAILWLVWILFKDIPNDHILSTRIAKVFNLPNYILLIALNIFIGGLIGGLSAWSAHKMTKAFSNKK